MDSQPGFYNHQKLIVLMFKEKLSRFGKQLIVDAEAAKNVGAAIEAAEASRVSVLDFEHLARLEAKINVGLG